MRAMDSVLIGLRAQDFHESLKNTSAFGPKEAYYRNTLLIGKAAVLAMHLRGILYVDKYEQLLFAAASLGITAFELTPVLEILEEVDFISVVRSGELIRRIDVRVPEFRSGYQDLGERWKLLNPSEIEQASIVTLDQLYSGPAKRDILLDSLGLDHDQYSMMIDVMESGALAGTEMIDGAPILYTPLAIDGNPRLYLQWAQKFPDEVSKAIRTLKENQGLPLDSTELKANRALNEAVLTGVLMPVAVNGATGTHQFAFAPHGSLSQEEAVILDKARAILACVRYGQNFAAGTPIRYPELILRQLRDRKRFKSGHPDLLTQYGLLTEKLIGFPVDEGYGRWNFQIEDTDENMRALDVALDMLEHGESVSARIDIEAQNALLSPSSYSGPIPTRANLAKSLTSSPRTRASIIREIGNIIRGVS